MAKQVPARKEAEHILSRHCPSLLSGTPLIEDPDLVVSHIHRALTEVSTAFYSPDQTMVAHNHIVRIIDAGNRDQLWNLPLPPVITRYTGESPFRDRHWFLNTRSLSIWYEQWRTASFQPTAIDNYSDADSILATAILSALIHGGLAVPEALESLFNTLRNEHKPLICAGNHVWIDLYFEAPGHALNVSKDQSHFTCRRWYPDPVSLAIIFRYLHLRDQKKSTDSDSFSCATLVLDQIGTFWQRKGGNAKSFKQLCRCAVGITERLPGVQLSSTHTSYIIGDVKSASLPPHAQKFAFAPSPMVGFANGIPWHLHQSPPLLTRKACSSFQDHSAKDLRSLFNDIHHALRPKTEAKIKRRRFDAINDLTNIQESNHLPESATTLIDWYIDQLQNKTLKLTTPKRYHSAIGYYWLVEASQLPLSSLDGIEFEQLYEDILSLTRNEKNKSYNAARLSHLHQYGVDVYGWPAVDIPFNGDTTTKAARVRAGYITQAMYQAILHHARTTPDLSDHCKDGLECLFIIAYRCGLRLGELIKLRMCDLECKDQLWLFIRSNRYADNKSYSALRKVPAHLLLTEEEATRLKRYFTLRRVLKGVTEKSLLFSSANNSYYPLPESNIRSFIQTVIRIKTDTSVVFHHLRHTALSNLQLVMDASIDTACAMTGYSCSQIKRIQELLVNKQPEEQCRARYWAIAGIAGHLDPSTTFHSYLHFTDLIVGERLQAADIKFTPKALSQLAGCPTTLIIKSLDVTQPLDNVSARDLQEVLLRRHNRYLKQLGDRLPSSKDSVPLTQDTAQARRRHPDISHCHTALAQIEQGASIANTAALIDQPIALVERWIESATALASLTTAHGHSRLIPTRRRESDTGLLLTPTQPPSTLELRQAEIAITRLRGLFRQNKDRVIWCLQRYIHGAKTTRSGIVFVDPQELRDFLAVMSQAFPLKEWEIVLNVPEHDGGASHRIWRQMTPNVTITQSPKPSRQPHACPHGRATLHLLHPSPPSSARTRYSSAALRYVMHSIAIMALSKEQIEAPPSALT